MGNRSAEFLNFKIHVYSLSNFASMLYTCRAINISSFKAAILDFRLQLASDSMEKSFFEFIDLENMGVAFGILQLCCIQAEI